MVEQEEPLPAQKRAKTTTKSKSRPSAPPRKRKTAADKVAENGPLNTPFFEETGAEWHGTNVDFEELAALRSMWELPAACHLLWLLQTPLSLRVGVTLLEYEAALLSPERSGLLEDVFTKLLLKKSERECLAPGIGLKYEWWNKQLREYYSALYDKWYALLRKAGEKTPGGGRFVLDSSEEEDGEEEVRDVELSDDEWLTLDILKTRLEGLGVECPLQHQGFAELPVVLRCRILLNLCEAVADDALNTDYVRQMEEDDLRVEPLGRDRLGHLFFYFPQFYNERRIYRLAVDTHEWTLWAKGEDACLAMLQALQKLKGRRGRGEQDLLDHLEVLGEQIAEEAEVRAKEAEKVTRRAILEAIPRKRSMRIQVKQIEQLEKQQEEEQQVAKKKALSKEELAELKRAEFLRRVEQEAEREVREKEREVKRIAKEEAEREAAQAEREQRRLRRLEQEKREEELLLQQEEAKRQQEEARKLRALQRKTLEEVEVEEGEEEAAVVPSSAGTPPAE